MFEHSVTGKISKKSFSTLIAKYSIDKIEVTDHALFRVSQKQRKIYEGDMLKKILLNEEPIEICKQYNKNLAIIYYYENDRKIKIIVRITPSNIYIVSFYILNQAQEKKVGK